MTGPYHLDRTVSASRTVAVPGCAASRGGSPSGMHLLKRQGLPGRHRPKRQVAYKTACDSPNGKERHTAGAFRGGCGSQPVVVRGRERQRTEPDNARTALGPLRRPGRVAVRAADEPGGPPGPPAPSAYPRQADAPHRGDDTILPACACSGSLGRSRGPATLAGNDFAMANISSEIRPR
ncbi:hypothetical protein GCM10012289_31460 [Nonomuraea cavernae]|uniref:Uncharacterized protein n=1 Tax=Nonomuraea cavernae TaxID=2045107 RepID=A0A918DJM9_9ACTN|nr:hypothetical protein GCM10012289_31460 [Nonomuraea cavernae]